MILTAFLFAGCGGKRAESETSSLESDDPTTTISDKESVDESEQSTTAAEMETFTFSDDDTPIDDTSGVSTLGRAADALDEDAMGEDTYGEYLIYQGGEMYLPCSLGAQGSIEGGVVLLMFLDGEPQPYRVEGGDGEGDISCAYSHVFYPEEDETMICEIYFTPLTGEAGETLEYWFAAIPWASYFPPEFRINPWLLTAGAMEAGGRILFEADTPDDQENQTVITEAAYDDATYTITYEDIQDNESLAISTGTTSLWYVDGARAVYRGIEYGVAEGDIITIRYVIYGSTYETFGLTFYLDHEPILVDGGAIPIEIQSGQKTVVELEFTLDEFDGSSILYAALAPQNYWTLLNSGLTQPDFLKLTDTVYLTSAANLEELWSGR
ncbi:MAG: hypothetical protein LUE29_09190 [Lachnospiraceae bacterium]|nr:hypothetical protein [Lachnospiraceae bacterium]